MMCLAFSVTMPIVTVFAVIFFFMRYYIEKYNFMFVYQQEYENYGDTREYLVPYQIFSVVLFQLFNYSFIRAKTKLDFSSWVGFSFIVFQLFMIMLFRFFFSRSSCFREKCMTYLFLKGQVAVGKNDFMLKHKVDLNSGGDALNEAAIKILRSSYEHPWHKIRRKIEFVQRKRELKVKMEQDPNREALLGS